MRVKIKYNGKWIYANPNQKIAFENYKKRPRYSQETPMTTNGWTVYRKNDDPYLPTYITDGTDEIPIADFDDVQVFLLDLDPIGWYNARNYQIWAYYDFMYDNKQRKTYVSKFSSHLAYPPNTQYVTEIDIDGLQPNIIFSISRNDNNSVYYERNDSNATRVRICDNNTARNGYLGFYRRMTMDVGLIISNPNSSNSVPSHTTTSQSQTKSLQLPANIHLEKTNNEEEQCIMCYNNKKNLTFHPCNHNITCSECYLKFTKKLECPICKGLIISLS